MDSGEKNQGTRYSGWEILEIGEGTLFIESREQEKIPLEKSRGSANIEGKNGVWYD